jgi:hypothetical protein
MEHTINAVEEDELHTPAPAPARRRVRRAVGEPPSRFFASAA